MASRKLTISAGAGTPAVQIGPRGGRYYVTTSGEKVYGEPPKALLKAGKVKVFGWDDPSSFYASPPKTPVAPPPPKVTTPAPPKPEAKPPAPPAPTKPAPVASVKADPVSITDRFMDTGSARLDEYVSKKELGAYLAKTFGPSPPKLSDFERAWSSRSVKTTVTQVSDLGRPGSSSNEGVHVRAYVDDRSGKPVGELRRTFYRDSAGKLVVSHDVFKLAEHAQGKGVATELLRNSLQMYQRLGVDRIETSTALSGRYVWARFGFDYAPKRDAYDTDHKAEMPAHFKKFLVERKGMAEAEAEKLSRSARSAITLAEAQHGREFLLSDDKKEDRNWRGVLHLQDGDPGYELLKKRVGL